MGQGESGQTIGQTIDQMIDQMIDRIGHHERSNR